MTNPEPSGVPLEVSGAFAGDDEFATEEGCGRALEDIFLATLSVNVNATKNAVDSDTTASIRLV